MKRLLISGEGKNELGSWALDRVPGDPVFPGVLEAMLRKVAPSGWLIRKGLCWRSIRKYRAGKNRRPEARNVLGLLQLADEFGCDTVVFSRDRDGDPRRQAAVEGALARPPDATPRIIGGMAIEALESWILSLRGEPGAEALRRPKQELGEMSTDEMVVVIAKADLARLPTGALSLRRWLEQARRVLVG